MPRATNGPASLARRKRVLKKARGMFGNKSRLYRYAKDAVDRGECFAYRDRKRKKSEFRKLWIVRLNAAVRPHDISYSRFMNGVTKAGIQLDRKALSELAIHDEAGFAKIVEQAKAALN
jgi:large subunit ribosomal protein L20